MINDYLRDFKNMKKVAVIFCRINEVVVTCFCSTVFIFIIITIRCSNLAFPRHPVPLKRKKKSGKKGSARSAKLKMTRVSL